MDGQADKHWSLHRFICYWCGLKSVNKKKILVLFFIWVCDSSYLRVTKSDRKWLRPKAPAPTAGVKGFAWNLCQWHETLTFFPKPGTQTTLPRLYTDVAHMDQKCMFCLRGWNSSAGSELGSLSCLMQRHGFGPPLGRIFSVEGIFPLQLTWILTPFLKNSFGWEYKPRLSLCIHVFHRTDSKDPDIHVLDGWMPATKTQPACTIHEDGKWLSLWLN